VKLVRGHVGKEVVLGADANNGYDLAQAKRFVKATAECRLAFVEEMFPESVEAYRELKALIRELELGTLIADGENLDHPGELRPLVEAGVVNILQGDMKRFGFEGVLAEAAMGRPHGATVAPHNWGSLLGYYMQLQVGRAVPNFYRAERDPLSCKALLADGFAIKDGTSSVPDAPGLGLRLDDKVLADVAKVRFDVRT
jgi:L-alanine-DL-glutamate epimerase-like enolase superfamily enzyme